MTPADIHKLTGTMASQTEKLQSVDKSLLEVVKLLKKREEKEQKKEKREAQEKRRSRADSDALGINKMLNKEKDKAKSGGGLFGNILGGLLKAKVMVAGLTTLLVGGIVAAVANPQVRAAAGKFWNDTIKPVIVRFWNEFIVPETKKLARTVGDIIKNTARRTVIDPALGRSSANSSLRDKISVAERRRDLSESPAEKAKIQKDIDALKKALKKQQEIDAIQNQIDSDRRSLLTGGGRGEGRTGQNKFIEETIKRNEEKLKTLREEKSKIQIPQGYQTGGAITVPGMGQGDKVPAMLPPGSFVLNRNASSHMHATGGMIPAMLEPGEMVFPHTTPGLMAMNDMIPRFQKGGEVTQDVAGSSRKGSSASTTEKSDEDKEIGAKSTESTKDKKGADAIIAAAEASIGLMKGVPLMCATTTREVLAAAGHPAANRITTTADLDVPVGFPQSLSSPSAAGSFAGTDMGTHYTDPKKAPPGSALLWRGTYDVDKYGPDAVTHVGLKGEAGAMYHHGKAQGWRKDSINRYPPSFAIDLNGEASGSAGGGGGKGGQSIMGQLFSGVNTFISEALGINMKEALSHFAKGFGKPGMFDNLFSDGSETESGSKISGTVPNVTPGAKGLLNFIAHYESGGDYNKIWGGSSIPGLTEMTIREVIKVQKEHLAKGNESAAIGRYQMMKPEMHAPDVGLTLDSIFSQENQDKLAMAYLEDDGWSRFKSGKMSSESFANNVAGTWAALPTSGGASAHAGVGSNKALVDRSTFMKQIEASKLQKGGTVGNVKYMNGFDSNAMFRKANDMKMGMDSRSSAPIIINNGGGGGGSVPQVVENTTATTPTLPDNPISDFSIGLIMNNNILSNRIGG